MTSHTNPRPSPLWGPIKALPKLTVCASIAAGVVVGLFAIMHGLIAHADGTPQPKPERIDIVLASTLEDVDVRIRETEPERPEDITPPPVTLDPLPAPTGENPLTLAAPIVPGPGGTEEIAIDFTKPPSVEQPIFRPVSYPETALRRGIEGECTVLVDVTPDGTVVNPRPTCTNTVFTRTIKRDALKWRYRPATGDDGAPVLRESLTVTVEFRLGE